MQDLFCFVLQNSGLSDFTVEMIDSRITQCIWAMNSIKEGGRLRTELYKIMHELENMDGTNCFFHNFRSQGHMVKLTGNNIQDTQKGSTSLPNLLSTIKLWNLLPVDVVMATRTVGFKRG